MAVATHSPVGFLEVVLLASLVYEALYDGKLLGVVDVLVHKPVDGLGSLAVDLGGLTQLGDHEVFAAGLDLSVADWVELEVSVMLLRGAESSPSIGTH